MYKERPFGQWVDPLANNILGGLVITGLSWCWKMVILGRLIRNAWFWSSWEIFRSSGVLHLIVICKCTANLSTKLLDFGEYPQDPAFGISKLTKLPPRHTNFTIIAPPISLLHYIHNCSPEKLRCNWGAFPSTKFHDFVPTVAYPSYISTCCLLRGCVGNLLSPSLVWRYLIMACTFCVVLWKCFD